MMNNKLKEFLYDIQREHNPNKIEQLIKSYNNHCTDFPKLKLKTDIPAQEGIREMSITQCGGRRVYQYKYSKLQQGFVYNDSHHLIVPIEFTDMEVIEYVNQRTPYVKCYEFNFGSMRFDIFDPSKQFVESYVKQSIDDRISKLQHERENIAMEDTYCAPAKLRGQL